MALDNLFSPIMIGNVKVPNRCAMAPMNLGPKMYTDNEVWPKKTIRYYEERAIGGIGLIITQFVRVYDKLASYPIAGLYEDSSIPAHAELVKRIHKYDTKIFHQIALMGGKDYTRAGEAPSSIYSPAYIYKPRSLTAGELDMLVERFIEAAGRGMQSGYDGVEIHGAHLYLIGQMLSPATNKRTDKYGGSFIARMRFITDIIKGIRAKYPEYNIGVKFNAFEELEDGIDIELGRRIAKHLSDLKVDYLHITTESTTLGIFSDYPPVPTMYQPRNTLIPIASEIKKICQDQVIIATGSITVPEEADTFIKERKCDMVALGRTVIADPAWANKAKNGKPVVPCIRCMVCYQQLLTGEMLVCSMNPYLLHESEKELPVPSKIKDVMIIGAGPAGIRCALTASRRGHNVSLYEKSPYIGGMIYPGSRPEFKQDVERALDYFMKELESSNVKLLLNTEVTPVLVNEINPDVIVVAIGAEPVFPEIPGIDSNKVISAIEVLRDIKNFKKGKAVIIGGGETGCETACHMADNNFDITIIEMLSDLLEENKDNNLKLSLLNLIEKRNIKVFTRTFPSKVVEDGLEVILPDGKQYGIKADIIVFAVGQVPNKDLVKELSLNAEEFYIIGDCNSIGRIKDAVAEGESIGRWI